MKKNFVQGGLKVKAALAALALTAAALPFSSCVLRTEEKNESQRWISVTGSGKVKVKNDAATINLAVVTYNRSVIEAARQNAEAVTKVRVALIDGGFPADSITTSDYRIWQDVSNRNGVQYRGDYRVTNSIHITTFDADKAGNAIDIAVKAGANEFSSIDFSATNIQDALREARTLAIKNAAEAANLMAKTAGAELGRVTKIIEQGIPAYTSREGAKLFTAADLSTPISAGNGEVKVTVLCEYELK